MNLLNPSALLLLVIALPITLLYVLRVRLRRAPVSSMMFWQQALADQPPRAFWQRFRHLASWLATLLLLLLLTLSAADVRWNSRSSRPQRLVLVLDVSSGMAASVGGASRLEAAQNAALRQIAELSDDDEAAVIAAGSVPQILCGLSSHQPTLRRAVSEARQTSGPAQLAEAVLLAQRLAAIPASAGRGASETSAGRVLVFSDGCENATPDESGENALRSTTAKKAGTPPATTLEPPQADVPVDWQFFGEAQPNVGFTVFELRRSDADPLGYEILIRLRNAADAAVTARIEIERNGVPLDVIPVAIDADGEWSRVVSKLSADGGRLRASLTDVQFAGDGASAAVADGLTADNTAWAVLPARPRQRVLLVSPGSLFVQKVLEAHPLVDLTVWRELPKNPAWPTDSLVVLHELVPTVLPPAPTLVLDPRSGCDLWTFAGETADPVLETVRSASAWMRNVRLEQVLIPAASVLEFTASSQVLAEANGGVPLYALLNRANAAPVLVLPIRFGGSDLAYRTVFPILVANALNEFAGRRRELPGAIVAGQTARLIVPGADNASQGDTAGPAKRTCQLQAPSGARCQLQASPVPADNVALVPTNADWQLITEPLLEAGIWEVAVVPPTDRSGAVPPPAAERPPIAEFAVNAAVEAEVDLRPVRPPSATADTTGTNAAGLPIASLTGWLLSLTLLLLAIDWALHQRRWLA
ncbi:MAG: VWA domain-containing protein [Planctomycetota bacterium]